MERQKYSSLERVKILETGIVNVNNYTSFFVFCMNNNITNLKELFEFVDNNELSNSEILGITELLKYKYLNQYINYDLLFIPIFSDGRVLNIDFCNDYGMVLKKFGFSPYECDFLLRYLYNNFDSTLNFGELFSAVSEDYTIRLDSVLQNKILVLVKCYLSSFEKENNKEVNVFKLLRFKNER